MSSRLAVCLALLTPCAVALQGQDRPAPGQGQDHDGRGALAVLRRDGLLFPFASFNRDSWRAAWPNGLTRQIDIPATREAIPEAWWGTRSPDQWRAYLTGGDDVFLQLGAPSVFRVFCTMQVGVRTTYRSAAPLPPVRVDPFPKDGLAVSGGVPLEPIETVSETSPEWAPMAASLVKDFDRIENETISNVRTFAAWRHPIPAATRRTLPIRLESWYRSPAGEPGWTVSYVETARQYPPGPDDKGCGLETIVSGWIHHRNGELMDSKQLRGKLTYCDRVGATYMLPFGRIRPRKDSYWVFQLSGWESESYEVVAVRPEKVRSVLGVFAGSGRRCY